jgi:hypothetical protein
MARRSSSGGTEASLVELEGFEGVSVDELLSFLAGALF